MQKLFTVFTLLTALLICSASAQTSGGTITGRVVDRSGANVPNVKVELENVATSQRITATTDSTGLYVFRDVPTGRYRLITTAATGTTAPTQEIAVDAGGTQTINLNLTNGPGTDALVDAQEVPTTMAPANIQRPFNTQSIRFLPQPNFVSKDGEIYGAYNLSLLSEGLTSGTGSVARGPAVSGSRPLTNNFHIDGIDNNNKVFPGPLAYVSNEATNGFAMFHNQPSPVFGHSSGGKFNSIVSTGTNKVHGSLYNYLQNRNLNAMDASLARFGFDENPRYDQNRLGGSLGLPIVPSKLFAFGSFEYIPLGFTRPVGPVSFAPTPAGFDALSRIGAVSSTNLGILRQNLAGFVGDPQTTTTVSGVTVPLGLVTARTDGWQNQYAGTGALDWTMSDRSALRGRYVHHEWQTNFSGPSLPDFQAGRKGKAMLASVAHYFTFPSAMTNELRVGFNRYANSFGLAGVSFNGVDQFPNLQIGDVTNLSLGTQFAGPQRAEVNTFHLADGLALRVNAMGGHNIRFGVDARRYTGYSAGFSASRGDFSYSSLERFLLDRTPDVSARRTFGDDRFDHSQWLWFGYIHDNWTLTPNFSLDLSLRYTYATIPEGLRAQRFNAIADAPDLISFADPRLENRNFAPHVGFAWAPGDNRYTVFRGGFGMFHDSLFSASQAGIYAPQFGVTALANPFSNATGFLRTGGIQDPTLGIRGDLTTAQARALTTTWVPPEQDLPYSLQWNAAVQQRIWRGMTFEAKYLGNRGVHQPWLTSLNNVMRVTPDRKLPVFLNRPSQAEINALPLTLNELVTMPADDRFAAAGFRNSILAVVPEGNSWYHGLALTLNQRFTGGFQMLGTYTWSHLIDDSTGNALDLGTFGRERANSIFDRRHRVNATALFSVAPLFENTFSVVRNVFANVTLGGTYTYESPQYVTVRSGLDTALSGNAFGSRALFNAEGTPGVGTDVSPLLNNQGRIVGYVANNPNAQFIRGGLGTLATSGRNSFPLNETNNFDVSAVKRFSYGDRWSFELRGDAYNVFNHPQFARGQVTSIGFGSLTSIPGYLVPSNPEFGNFRDAFASNARTLQVALRVAF